MNEQNAFSWCRTCLKRCENTTNILTMENNIVKVLNECLSIQFHQHDSLPDQICYTCLEVIKKFWYIKEQSWKNEEILREYVRLKTLQPLCELEDVISGFKVFDMVIKSEEDVKVETTGELNGDVSLNLGDHVDDDVDENVVNNEIDAKTVGIDDVENVHVEIRKRKVKYKNRKISTTHRIKRTNSDKPENSLKCPVCDESFSSKQTLSRHSATHPGTRDFKCDECSRSFLNVKHLQRHKMFHDEPKYICKYDGCQKKFYRSDYLMRHVKSAHETTGSYRCGTCGRNFSSQFSLTRHMITHPEMPKHPCDRCELVFATKKSLTRHYFVHGEPLYRCPDDACGMKFYRLDKLMLHAKRTHNTVCEKNYLQLTYNCSQCDAKFLVNEQLTHHIARHHVKSEKQPTKNRSLCQLCGVVVKNMNTHMLSHDEVPCAFKCSVCDSSFKTQTRLTEHVKRIHEVKVCHVCGETYVKATHLATHKATEVKVKVDVDVDGAPFGCDLCGKRFESADRLRRHTRQVHNPKYVECHICKHKVRKKTFKYHVRVTHENKRDFQCTVCASKFPTNFLLTTHMRMHTDERPYDCTYCAKSFRSSSTLKKHVRLHTGERPYVCSMCGKAFVQSTALNLHILTHVKKKVA